MLSRSTWEFVAWIYMSYTLCFHLLNVKGWVKQTSNIFEKFQSTHQTYFNGASNSPIAVKNIEALYQHKQHLITINTKYFGY